VRSIKLFGMLFVAVCAAPLAVRYVGAAVKADDKGAPRAASASRASFNESPAAQGSPERCRAVAGWSQGDVAVLSAEPVAAGTEVAMPMAPVKANAPAHCLVRGEIARRTGADGKSYAISFELRLPDDWNGRFLYQGGGGFDGFLWPALGAMTGGPTTALERGFAVVSTDAGHRDSGAPGAQGDFGTDPQARRDYAYNALDRVTVTAKDLVTRYYATAIRRSYFAGCSGGGRQAMLASQRFPTYFDGIVGGAPGMYIADIGIAGLRRFQALDRLPGDAEHTLQPADQKLIFDALLAQCDALDGRKDGIVFNQRQCHFDPGKLLCHPGGPQACLSSGKLETLEALISPTRTSDGRMVYNGFHLDTGVATPEWLFGLAVGLPGSSHKQSMRSVQLAYVTPPVERDYQTLTVDQLVAGSEDMRRMTETASTDLDAFRARGGKILLYHGMSDQIVSPDDTIHYYEALSARYGPATGQFARFFAVPGMLHCFGGPGPASFDPLAAMVDWVEHDRAPDRLIATNSRTMPGQSRPLCPYPSYARYEGRGDPARAESYACAR